jgi:hypothetical protein
VASRVAPQARMQPRHEVRPEHAGGLDLRVDLAERRKLHCDRRRSDGHGGRRDARLRDRLFDDLRGESLWLPGHVRGPLAPALREPERSVVIQLDHFQRAQPLDDSTGREVRGPVWVLTADPFEKILARQRAVHAKVDQSAIDAQDPGGEPVSESVRVALLEERSAALGRHVHGPAPAKDAELTLQRVQRRGQGTCLRVGTPSH